MTYKRTIYTVFCALLLTLLGVALVGVVTADGYNRLPATQILEVVFFTASFFMFFGGGRERRGSFFCGVALSAYLLAKYLFSFGGGATFFDFLLSVKAFLYIAILALSLYVGFIPYRLFGRFLFVLCLLFLIKYLYIVLLGGSRPGLFTENNFELLFLSLLVYRYCIEESKEKFSVFCVYSLIVFLSFSRSALLLVGYLYFVLFVLSGRRFVFFKLLGLFAVVFGAAAIISLRQPDDLSALDRFVFLQVFLSETSEWSFFDYLFGNVALTPLSRGACYELAYYETLFSDSGDGGCYSVILHSFLLRTIFDHGMVGLFAVFGSVWFLIRSSGFGRLEAFSFLILLFLNGLSVSSMNSVYAALGLLFFVSVKRFEFEGGEDGCYVVRG